MNGNPRTENSHGWRSQFASGIASGKEYVTPSELRGIWFDWEIHAAEARNPLRNFLGHFSVFPKHMPSVILCVCVKHTVSSLDPEVWSENEFLVFESIFG